MKEYHNGHFEGERALFRLSDAKISDSLFDNGESPLKEGRNLIIDHVTFGYKYPLWYGKGHQVTNCTFLEMSRSGLWYTEDSSFSDLDIIAPKEFRRCRNITLERVRFANAQETLWNCSQVTLKELQAKGDYFGMGSEDVTIENMVLDGNYAFDGGKNIKAKNCVFNTKDAFWNCENVTLQNCVLNGEYFSWNSRNITLIDCKVTSHQGFCYMENVVLKNTSISPDSDLIFEYCKNLDVETPSLLLSVKNPESGTIRALSVKELIQDDERIDKSKIRILVRKGSGYEEI